MNGEGGNTQGWQIVAKKCRDVRKVRQIFKRKTRPETTNGHGFHEFLLVVFHLGWWDVVDDGHELNEDLAQSGFTRLRVCVRARVVLRVART